MNLIKRIDISVNKANISTIDATFFLYIYSYNMHSINDYNLRELSEWC